jgi:lipopolysaccharide export system permease protein
VIGSILHRTIFLELVQVFALSLLGITGILAMAGIVAEASQRGLSPAQVLAVAPLLIPSTLPYTIPATTLFATCVVYGRLAHDNEITAIKSAGINILQVVWPGVVLGLLMSALTLGLYYRLIPTTQHLLRSRFLNDVEDLLYAMLKKDHAIVQPGLNYEMHVRQVQGTRLLGALFKRRDDRGRYDMIALAREAELRVDLPNRQLLVQMRNVTLLGPAGETRGQFEGRVWPVQLPPTVATRKPVPREMTWKGLLQRRHEVATEEQTLAEDLAAAVARQAGGLPTADPAQDPTFLQQRLRGVRLERNSINTELQARPALSLGCLAFVLVGCPVGIWFSRSDYLSAFMTCFLPILFIYYPLLLCGTNFAKDGRIHPAVALWAANVVLGLLSLVLFRRLLKN